MREFFCDYGLITAIVLEDVTLSYAYEKKLTYSLKTGYTPTFVFIWLLIAFISAHK